MAQPDRTINFSPPGPTVRRFMQSDARVRLLIGPLGSAKSSSAVVELIRRAKMQKPSPVDNKRKVKILVVRGTFGELESATLPTWDQWLPLSYGKTTYGSPITAEFHVGDLDLEVHFMALDKDEDAKKVLSTEYSFAWLDETKTLSKAVFDAIFARLGRYPSRMQGGCTWSGAILTTNPFGTDHWLYKTAIEECPAIWEVFKQPSGLSPEAENIQNLPKNYYQDLIQGRDADWVAVNVHGEFRTLIEGKPVYENSYRDSLHGSTDPIAANPSVGLVVGADFGLVTNAAVIGQKFHDGRLIVLDELVTDNISVQKFASTLSSYIATNFPDHYEVSCWCDPAGGVRSLNDEKTAIEVMNEHTQWKWRPAPGDNRIEQRLEAVRYLLDSNPLGKPNLLISSRCKILRKAMISGYHFRLAKSGNGAVTIETPEKNHPYSDIADALGYLVIGTGGYDTVLNRQRRDERERRGPIKAKGRDYSIFGKRSWES